jgi:hypothetical protein
MKICYSAALALLFGVTLVTVAGCYDHKINSVETWCEQINGDDLFEKYQPF